MRKRLILLATLLLAACATTAPAPMLEDTAPNAANLTFSQFYAQLRKQVAGQGLNPAVLDAAFPNGVHPVREVLQTEKAQPEATRTFSAYTGPMLSQARVSQATQQYQRHQDVLHALQTQTGVSGSVVVALWGIETSFGKNSGEHPIIPALATLAWQSSSRPEFYKKELFAALKIATQQHRDPTTMLGSWAGAMGQCQFMPTTYLAYAQDGDGDGLADIWNDTDDVFASAANFLQKHGWQSGQAWRLPVSDELDLSNLTINSRGLSDPISLSQWHRRGYTGNPAGFGGATQLRYYKPETSGPAFLLGPNFSVILSWNNSSYFAYSALALADVINATQN